MPGVSKFKLETLPNGKWRMDRGDGLVSKPFRTMEQFLDLLTPMKKLPRGQIFKVRMELLCPKPVLDMKAKLARKLAKVKKIAAQPCSDPGEGGCIPRCASCLAREFLRKS